MKKQIIILATIILPIITFGNNSIIEHFNKDKNDKKVENLIKKLNSTDSIKGQEAIIYAIEALNWATENDRIKDQALLTNYIGNTYYIMGNLEQALSYYQKTLRHTLAFNNKNDVAKIMQKIGLVNFNLSDRKKALLYFHQALRLYIELDHPNNQAEMYTNMGSIYYFWQDYDKALENYNKALYIYKKLENVTSASNLLYLKGITLHKLNQNQEAIQTLENSVIELKKVQNLPEVAKIYDAIGDVFFTTDELEKAMLYYMKAYDIHTVSKDSIIIAQSLNKIGNTYLEMGNFKEAKLHLDKSMKIAENLNLTISKVDNLKSYYELHYIQGYSEEALRYFQQYKNLKEAVLSNSSSSDSEYSKYANKMLDLKKQILVQNKAYKQLMNITFAIVFVLIVIIIRMFVVIKTRKNGNSDND